MNMKQAFFGNMMEQWTEEPFFFDNEGSKLFGILHTPRSPEPKSGVLQSKGIVFCHPFAEEKTISHRVITNFARLLCRQGYYVLRFDYCGCGDSEGDFAQATLTTRISDISKAIDVLLEHTGTSILSLFGLRLGGTLAALVAAADSRVNSLILWEPIVQVRAYFKQFLRMQVIAENRRRNRVLGTLKSLVQELQEGRCVDIVGYCLSPKCFEEFTRVNVLARIGRFRGPTLIVSIGRQNRDRKDLQALLHAYLKTNTDVELIRVQERLFWIDPNDPFRELASWHGHDSLFEKTTDWLNTVWNAIA